MVYQVLYYGEWIWTMQTYQYGNSLLEERLLYLIMNSFISSERIFDVQKDRIQYIQLEIWRRLMPP